MIPRVAQVALVASFVCCALASVIPSPVLGYPGHAVRLVVAR